jgi:hypothetical protein
MLASTSASVTAFFFLPLVVFLGLFSEMLLFSAFSVVDWAEGVEEFGEVLVVIFGADEPAKTKFPKAKINIK